jgi:hypothetical protein
MKIKIKKRYYKRVLTGREPIKFEAYQPKGVGTDVVAVLKIDPILRKKRHSDLHRAMVKHEIDEIKHWGQNKRGCSHSHAKKQEPLLTRRIKGVAGFWQEIKRRKNKR